MRIITISREFGSGGRELGKRLADWLGFDYYDREIITAIAQNQGLDEKYAENTLDNHGWQTIPVTFHRSRTRTYDNYSVSPIGQDVLGQTRIVSCFSEGDVV